MNYRRKFSKGAWVKWTMRTCCTQCACAKYKVCIFWMDDMFLWNTHAQCGFWNAQRLFEKYTGCMFEMHSMHLWNTQCVFVNQAMCQYVFVEFMSCFILHWFGNFSGRVVATGLHPSWFTNDMIFVGDHSYAWDRCIKSIACSWWSIMFNAHTLDGHSYLIINCF